MSLRKFSIRSLVDGHEFAMTLHTRMRSLCDCAAWARVGDVPLLLSHHPACKHYRPEIEIEPVLRALVHGIEAWAAEEDGVHPDAWEPYQTAKAMIGEPVRVVSA